MIREAMTALAAMGVLMVGCGGSVVTGGTTGSGGGTTGTSTTGTTGSGGGPCAGFDDQQGTSTVTVRFRNDTGQDVYIPGNCSSIEYTITPIGGSDGNSYTYDPSCLQTCQDLQTQPQYQCGACLPTSYRIAPGATRDVVWEGTALSTIITMPAACWNTPGGGTGCRAIVAANQGSYRIDAVGYAGCEGDCTCDASGLCNGFASGQVAQADLTKFDFPGGAPVEVVFGGCAFGCPDGAK